MITLPREPSPRPFSSSAKLELDLEPNPFEQSFSARTNGKAPSGILAGFTPTGLTPFLNFGYSLQPQGSLTSPKPMAPCSIDSQKAAVDLSNFSSTDSSLRLVPFRPALLEGLQHQGASSFDSVATSGPAVFSHSDYSIPILPSLQSNFTTQLEGASSELATAVPNPFLLPTSTDLISRPLYDISMSQPIAYLSPSILLPTSTTVFSGGDPLVILPDNISGLQISDEYPSGQWGFTMNHVAKQTAGQTREDGYQSGDPPPENSSDSGEHSVAAETTSPRSVKRKRKVSAAHSDGDRAHFSKRQKSGAPIIRPRDRSLLARDRRKTLSIGQGEILLQSVESHGSVNAESENGEVGYSTEDGAQIEEPREITPKNVLSETSRSQSPALTEEDRRKSFLERNRQAALKCRQRKKQWVQSLQQTVENLTVENDDLQKQATNLREDILNLKTLLIAHKDCPVARANGLTDLAVIGGAEDVGVTSAVVLAPNKHSNPAIHPAVGSRILNPGDRLTTGTQFANVVPTAIPEPVAIRPAFPTQPTLPHHPSLAMAITGRRSTNIREENSTLDGAVVGTSSAQSGYSPSAAASRVDMGIP